MFIWLFYAFNLLLVLTHIVPHVTDIGFSSEEAAIFLSVISGMSIVGLVLMGRVSDSIGRKTTAIICSLLLMVAMISLIWAQNLWMLYLFAITYGFAQGGFVSPLTALIGDTYGLRNIGLIVSMLNIGWGIGAAIGPTIGGLIFDVKNSYSIAFLMAGAAMLIATLLIALIRQEAETNY